MRERWQSLKRREMEADRGGEEKDGRGGKEAEGSFKWKFTDGRDK